jgi:hypothetical protein
VEIGELSARFTNQLKRWWRLALWVVGVPTLLDILKEYVRGKAVDWLFSSLGNL